jgi:hypothetical protein
VENGTVRDIFSGVGPSEDIYIPVATPNMQLKNTTEQNLMEED